MFDAEISRRCKYLRLHISSLRRPPHMISALGRRLFLDIAPGVDSKPHIQIEGGI